MRFTTSLINSNVFSVVFVPGEQKEGETEIEPVPSISFFAVYRYADKIDILLLVVGVVLCLVQGGFNSGIHYLQLIGFRVNHL